MQPDNNPQPELSPPPAPFTNPIGQAPGQLPPHPIAPQPEDDGHLPKPFVSTTKRRLTLLFFLLLILIVIGVIGASIYYKIYKNNSTIPTQPAVIVHKAIPAPSQLSSVVSANNTLGVNVFNQLVNQTPGENVFISPTSIAMALSMVYNGAEGSTATAMQQTLGYQGLSTATINDDEAALLSGLRNPDPKVTLAVANSAWLRQGFPIKSSFLDTVSNYYQAKATTLNFSDPSSVTTINNWVSGATDGKIPTIVSKIPSNEILYLINALYFDGGWHTAFDPSATEKSAFTTGSGSVIQFPLMSQTGSYNHFQNADLQSIELPYGHNKQITMNVYLPTNITTFLHNLTYAQLAGYNSDYSQSSGTILLPKVTLNYAQDLNAALKNLGMNTAFNDTANFNGIAQNLYISDVKHATYLAINEQGTVAAAATSVDVAVGTAVEPSGFTMDVNKPFVFTIQDNANKDILFVGVILNPDQTTN